MLLLELKPSFLICLVNNSSSSNPLSLHFFQIESKESSLLLSLLSSRLGKQERLSFSSSHPATATTNLYTPFLVRRSVRIWMLEFELIWPSLVPFLRWVLRLLRMRQGLPPLRWSGGRGLGGSGGRRRTWLLPQVQDTASHHLTS